MAPYKPRLVPHGLLWPPYPPMAPLNMIHYGHLGSPKALFGPPLPYKVSLVLTINMFTKDMKKEDGTLYFYRIAGIENKIGREGLTPFGPK